MKLLQFHARAFCNITGTMSQVFTMLEHDIMPGEPAATLLKDAIAGLVRESDRLGLRSVGSQAKRTSEYLNTQSINPKEVHRLLIDLYLRMLDELESERFLYVPMAAARLYESPFDGWGDVPDKFPAATPEIEEAGKCLALDRPTAAVFHMMRVLEVSLSAIAKALSIDKHSPTWNAYFGAFREAVDLQYPESANKTKPGNQKRASSTLRPRPIFGRSRMRGEIRRCTGSRRHTAEKWLKRSTTPFVVSCERSQRAG
jgi:hypothetical protein